MNSVFEDVASEITKLVNALPKPDGTQQRALSGRQLDMLHSSVRKLIRDSVGAWFSNTGRSLASIHKNKNDYSHGKLGPDLSHRITVDRAYNGMIRLGYLQEEIKGVSDGPVGRFLTRYKATEQLVYPFANMDPRVVPAILPPDDQQKPIKINIVKKVKSESGKLDRPTESLPVPDTPATRGMTERITRINKAIGRVWIDLELSDAELRQMCIEMTQKERLEQGQIRDLNFAKRTLYRVFNDNDMRRGGRFNGGWWQNIPSEYRSRILIDGKRTVEWDYSGLHPAMLYAERSLDIPEDPYVGIIQPVDNSEESKKAARKAAKKVLNAMLNASAPMQGQPKGLRLSDFGMKWPEAVENVTRIHAGISDAFFSDSGAMLQRIDSDMAEEVMLKFANLGSNIPVLPIHDSFVVHWAHKTELIDAMAEVFEDRFGVPIKINPKEDKLDAESGVRPLYDPDNDSSEHMNLDDIIAANDTGYNRRLDAFRDGVTGSP